MSVRSMHEHVTSALALFASVAIVCSAQVPAAEASSASHVAAEMTKGKLNPASSKPGDTVAIMLKDDVRSNGEVIFKKGTMITGIVRNVKRAEDRGEWKGRAQCMIEIEWLVPAASRRGVQSVSFSLHSVLQLQTDAQRGHEQTSSNGDFDFVNTVPNASLAARPVSSRTTSLLEPSETVPNAGPSAPSTAAASQSNVALLSMPSVVAADQQTSENIETALGIAPSAQLYGVGRGQLVSAGGSRQTVDLYSHLSNDTVITSPDKNFEISSGAHLQMLVGVNRK